MVNYSKKDRQRVDWQGTRRKWGSDLVPRFNLPVSRVRATSIIRNLIIKIKDSKTTASKRRTVPSYVKEQGSLNYNPNSQYPTSPQPRQATIPKYHLLVLLQSNPKMLPPSMFVSQWASHVRKPKDNSHPCWFSLLPRRRITYTRYRPCRTPQTASTVQFHLSQIWSWNERLPNIKNRNRGNALSKKR